MSLPKFVWIIRSWCSQDTYWEHVREHKEYDIAYTNPTIVMDEIERIIQKEQSDWEDICVSGDVKKTDREFDIEKPSLDQLKSRSFYKFMTVSSTNTASEEFMQSWYVERLKIIDHD